MQKLADLNALDRYAASMTRNLNKNSSHPAKGYKPQGIGDLLDQSLSLLRRRFVHIFAISVALQLVYFSLGLWSGSGTTLSSQLALLASNLTDFSQMDDNSSALLGLLSLIGKQFLGAAAVIFVAADLDQKSPDFQQVLKALLEVLPKLLWTVLVLALLAGLGLLLLVAGSSLFIAMASAIGDFFAVLTTGLVIFIDLAVATSFFLYIALSPVVVVVEGVSGMQAIRRSAWLVSTHNGPGFKNNNLSRMSLIYLVVMLSAFGVEALFSLPAMVVQFFLQDLIKLFSSPALSTVMTLLSQIFEVLGQAAISPFAELALAYFYFDLRARHEGLDLVLATRRLVDGASQNTASQAGKATL